MQLHNGGLWSDGRFKGFITSALRGAMRRWPPKWSCLKDAFVGSKINKKSGRKAKHYKCALCLKEFVAKGVQVDHIKPVGKCDSWDEYIERLFCEGLNLQVLCLVCHKKKTKKENTK